MGAPLFTPLAGTGDPPAQGCAVIAHAFWRAPAEHCAPGDDQSRVQRRAQHVTADVQRVAEQVRARGVEVGGRERGPAGSDRRGNGPADHTVGGAVIQAAGQDEFFGEVGRPGEVSAGGSRERVPAHLQGANHLRAKSHEPAGQAERAGHFAARVEPVVAAGRGRALGDQQTGRPPDE